MPTPQRNTTFIRRVLYRLKRRFGAAITIIRDTETLDPRTGKKVVTKQTWEVKRAILLPNTQLPKFAYDLAYIANAKNFTYGAIFNTSDRRVILDSKEVPDTYEPQQEDYFTFENRRWNIVQIGEFEYNTGYFLVGQRVEGAPVRDVHNANARNRSIFSQSVEEEIV